MAKTSFDREYAKRRELVALMGLLDEGKLLSQPPTRPDVFREKIAAWSEAAQFENYTYGGRRQGQRAQAD